MPHQCTNCDRTFEDGSKQMLGGCPDCGGNKFQFLPSGSLESRRDTVARPPLTDPVPTGPAETDADSATIEADSSIIEAPPEPLESDVGSEDRAQASARRSVVTKDELPPTTDPSRQENPDTTTTEGVSERSDLAALRRELNEQFESIKILQPGQYELNLMELYDREEYIIALEEDGRYVINVPDTWNDDE